MAEDLVLFHDRDKVRVGGVFRYDIYLEVPDSHDPLFLRVRNTELAALRAAYLNGPFTLYVDMMPMDYSEYVKTEPGAEPRYENHLKAGSHFSALMNVRGKSQRWRVTISSEILFSRSAEVNFEITIGTTKHASKLHGTRADKHVGADTSITEFKVDKYDTAAIWQMPIPRPDKPLHVCILTHGLVSNVTADMLYLKELLDQTADMSGENLVCKGYTGNVCRTERGVKYLGMRLANWIVNELIPTYKPARLSFIAHSLGGLVQTYALGYIQATNPHAFDGIELVNFIALASPFLGISHENPGYVQFALSFGVVGKTGRDLGLAWEPGDSKPVLERLPGEDTMKILRRFVHRTVYANAMNDGIVPLRTASLLYLDWRAIGQATAAENAEKHPRNLLHHHHPGNSRGEGQNHSHGAEDQSVAALPQPSGSAGTEGAGGDNDTTHPEPKKLTQTSTSSSITDFLFGESKQVRLARYQTVSDVKDPDIVGEKLPKKTSLIESGMSLLLPPHPDSRFITDPSSRDDVIFHDRTYYQQDLPPRRFKSRLSIIRGVKEQVDVAKSEERIARNYHSGTSWRKVLVQLLPEAHNNIIVRRRFSNAYGWPVIHHLVREHFLFPAACDKAAENIAAVSLETDSLDYTESEKHIDEREAKDLWSESDEDKETEPDKDHDPQRASMLKIIPTSER